MDVLKITLDEDGKVLDFSPDFKVYRGSYKNILINIEVPKCLLIEEATDGLIEGGKNISGREEQTVIDCQGFRDEISPPRL